MACHQDFRPEEGALPIAQKIQDEDLEEGRKIAGLIRM